MNGIVCQDLLFNQALPKCCESENSIFETNTTLFCNKSTNKRLVINSHLKNKTNEDALCVDATATDFYVFEMRNTYFQKKKNISEISYPKCCPVGFVYNYHNKSCDILSEETVVPSYLIKVGLPHCAIINDYVFSSNELYFKKLQVIQSDYCVDNTTENQLILRACESIDICKTTRCIHKCCADGKSFVNGSHCEDTMEKGFKLNHLTRNIENLKG